MEIPSIVIPPVENIKTISIPLPTADVPYYVPLVVPPSDLKEPEGTEPLTTTETPATPTLNLPPLPPIPYSTNGRINYNKCCSSNGCRSNDCNSTDYPKSKRENTEVFTR